MQRYVELQATSHFSFLRGSSSCEDIFSHAAYNGIEALAIVDRNSLAGMVRAHEAAKVTGVRLIVGCRLDLIDGSGVLVYPTDRPAYSRLCRLLSLGKRRAGKAKCHLDWTDLPDFAEGLIAILVPDEADEACAQRLRRLKATFTAGAYLALSLRRRPGDALRLHELSNLAAQAGVETVVTNDVLFHHPERRMLQDEEREKGSESFIGGPPHEGPACAGCRLEAGGPAGRVRIDRKLASRSNGDRISIARLRSHVVFVREMRFGIGHPVTVIGCVPIPRDRRRSGD